MKYPRLSKYNNFEKVVVPYVYRDAVICNTVKEMVIARLKGLGKKHTTEPNGQVYGLAYMYGSDLPDEYYHHVARNAAGHFFASAELLDQNVPFDTFGVSIMAQTDRKKKETALTFYINIS